MNIAEKWFEICLKKFPDSIKVKKSTQPHSQIGKKFRKRLDNTRSAQSFELPLKSKQLPKLPKIFNIIKVT